MRRSKKSVQFRSSCKHLVTTGRRMPIMQAHHEFPNTKPGAVSLKMLVANTKMQTFVGLNMDKFVVLIVCDCCFVRCTRIPQTVVSTSMPLLLGTH